MSGGWQDLYACYTHTVYTSGMQEVSSACPTGRLQLQLHVGNVQLTTDRHVSYRCQQYWCKLFSSFCSAVQQRHSSVVAEDAIFAALCCLTACAFHSKLGPGSVQCTGIFQLLATFSVNHFWPHIVFSPPSMM